jgi:hypothetical protein
VTWPAARLAAALVVLASPAVAPAARIGVEMPAAGDDGARGLGAVTAIRLGLGADRVVVRDSANGGFLNPHRDEGSDNGADLRAAPPIVAAFAADRTTIAAIGGLRRNVGDADAAVAEARGLPLIVLSRWSRNRRMPATVFCLCPSPPRLAASARSVARKRFGPRVLLVLVGDAGMLPAIWPHRFDEPSTARVGATAASVEAVRRRARDVDAVVVIADERPPTLWRGSAFRERFDTAYVRRFSHRDFQAIPAGTPRGQVAVLHEVRPEGNERRAFAARYRASAGFLPGDEAAAAYAAAQVLEVAGSDRAAVRRALQRRRFDTVIGSVAFDADGYRATSPLAALP